MCQFLYACVSILLYIFVVLCLFWCFRVILEGNRRKEQKSGENEQNGQNWQKAEKLSKAESQHLDASFRVTTINFPILAENGQWAYQLPDLLGYKRDVQTLSKGFENSGKRKRRELKDEEFLQSKPPQFCNFLLVSSSTFLPSQFLCLICIISQLCQAINFYWLRINSKHQR